jgi:hypothetical protein
MTNTWNGAHQLLVYGQDNNLLCGNINAAKNEALLDTRKEVRLRTNAEKAN